MKNLKKRETYHVGNLEPLIIKQANKMLEEVGPNKISIRAIAENLGVSPTALYYHFTNKDDLLNKISANGFSKLRSLMESSQKDLHPKLKLSALMKAYFNFAINNPALYQLMLGPILTQPDINEEVNIERQKSYRIIETCVSEILNADIISKTVKQATFAAWSATHGLATMVILKMVPIKDTENKDIIIDNAIQGYINLFNAQNNLQSEN